MEITEKNIKDATKVDAPKNTANPFNDFLNVLPENASLNTLYKISDSAFIYIPDDKRYKDLRSIHLVRRIKSSSKTINSFEDTTISKANKISRKTVHYKK